MKKFLFNVVLFSFLFLLIVILGLLITRVTKPNNLYFSLIDKHQMLKEKGAPRIVLVGGSNLSFGINSKLIKDTFNVNVINTSVHAGLGLKFITEDIVRFINKGDVVILSPEYEHFYGNTLYGNEPMLNTVVSIPETYEFFSFHNWKEIVGVLPETALKNIVKFGFSKLNHLSGIKKTGIYDRDSFNEYGDAIAHYDLKPEEFNSSPGMKGEFNSETINTILLFKEKIEKKGGLLVFTYPCLMRSSFASITREIDKINYEMVNHKIPIIGTPQRYSLDDSLYFNSSYHLTFPGVNIRTTHLIEDLQENTIFMSFLNTTKK